MAISFHCPHCHKPYKLKDELAGKKVTCAEPACRKAFAVPTPITATLAKPLADAEKLAAAAFAEEVKPTPAEADIEGAPIQLKCRFCDHANVFEARLAGKNAPCQNDECRKILRVPLPEKTGPKDWRDTGKQLPTLARRDTEQIEGAWGNIETAAVSREALVGARATERDDEPEPPNWARRIVYGTIAVAVIAIGIWSVSFGIRKYDDRRAGRSMQTALAFEYADPKTGQKRKLDKAPDGIIRMLAGTQALDQGKAKEAKAFFEDARGKLEPINSYERAAVIIDLAALLAELTGSRVESDEGKRIEWVREKLGASVRATMEKLPPGSGEDGRDMRAHACRVLTLRLAKRNHVSGAIQIANAIAPPDEQGQLMAVVGLELLALGERDKAEELAKQASASGSNDGAAALIALWLALAGPDAAEDKRKQALERIRTIAPAPGKEGVITATTRVGYAEGLARQGDLSGARALAWRNGKPDERLRAGARVAFVTRDPVDLDACAQHLDAEFKDRAVAPWLLLSLVETANTAKRSELADKFAAAIKEPGLRSWAQYLIVRARTEGVESPDFAWAEAVGDSEKLGQALAVAAIARQKAKVSSRGAVFKEINKWPDERSKMKAFGFAGMALANSEWR